MQDLICFGLMALFVGLSLGYIELAERLRGGGDV